jgi:hypothetical protein
MNLLNPYGIAPFWWAVLAIGGVICIIGGLLAGLNKAWKERHGTGQRWVLIGDEGSDPRTGTEPVRDVRSYGDGSPFPPSEA